MKVKEFIKSRCETCEKELINKRQFNKCFNADHILHSRGQLILKKRPMKISTTNNPIIVGRALQSIKAGDTVEVRLE